MNQLSTDIPKQAVSAVNSGIIEHRTIDFIPESERHGSLFSQFTLWFGANLQITAIVTGALAVVLGGDVFWSIIGLFIGQLFGAFVMALHAVQGPKLGLPQMISSRVQFGVLGAGIPIALVCVMYIGFIATGSVLSGQALSKLFNISTSMGILIFAGLIIIFASLGYRIIHVMGKVSSVVGVLSFIYLFGAIFAKSDISSLLAVNHFSWTSFFFAIALSASWQISYGPYVADYSRYLPSNTDGRKVFWSVFSGTVIGAQLAMILGVFVAQLAQGSFLGHEVSYMVGLSSAGLIAVLLYASIVVGKLTMSVLSAYGSFMCMATMVSGANASIKFTKMQRIVVVILVVCFSAGIALVGQAEFLKLFKNFILFLLTFFIPWSAINLVDYYKISKGRYNIEALGDVNGQYGKWNWVGLGCYMAGILIQLPFIDSPFFTGSIAKAVGGLDLSWLVGLVATGILYYFLAKRQRDNTTLLVN